MRLNAHMVLDALSESHAVSYFGPKSTQLHLKRPEIYNIYEGNPPFCKNRTYCLTTDSLPTEPIIEAGVLLICIGPELPRRYQQGDIRCIWLKEDSLQIITLFNMVQRIFDCYDDWEYQIQVILNTTGSIQQMVDACETILSNPIVVIDAALRFLGCSHIVNQEESLSMYRPGPDGKVQLAHLEAYHSFRDVYTKAGPQFYSSDNNMVYIWDVWLHERYLGNVTMPCVYRPYRESDRWVLSALEKYIALALTRYDNNPDLRINALRSAFQDILEGRTVGEDAFKALSQGSSQYLCIRIQFQVCKEQSRPVSLYCSYIENALPSSICFLHKSTIVAFAEQAGTTEAYAILPQLKRLAEKMNFQAGVSYGFTEPSQAKFYEQQASFALKYGRTQKNHAYIFLFQSCALHFLLKNGVHTMPLETLYTDGLRRLMTHDATSKVSFCYTLLIYLRNAMNITRTAIDLEIHRSSFLERLRNIEGLLESDLENPAQRLYLQLILENMFYDRDV